MFTLKKFIALATLVMSTSSVAQAVELQQVMYQEVDPGTSPAVMRILVNDDYFRIDGGNDKESFILLDRSKHQIISVNHEDRTVIHIQPQKNTASLVQNSLRVESQALDNSPLINGTKATLHTILSNEVMCRQVVSFKGLLPKVTQAWTEYESVIQQQNRNTLNRTPQDMRTECFMANNITHATEFLKYGLPFNVKSKDGNVRMLQGYSNVTKSDKIFAIPENYQQINL